MLLKKKRFNIFHLLTFKFLFFLYSFIFSQIIVKETFDYKLIKLLYDSGESWEELSIFNDVRKRSSYVSKNNLIETDFSFRTLNEKFSFANFSSFKLKNLIHGYNYFTYGDKIPPFSLYKDPAGNVLNDKEFTIENKFSALGYQNNWLSIQIVKGNEQWSSGDNIELL